jgi:cyclase
MRFSKLLRTTALAALATVALQGSVSAQGPQPADLPKGDLLHTIKDGKLYWLETPVPNVGFIIGDTGVILFDDGVANVADIVKKVTDKPITTVIESHDDTDHINGLYTTPNADKLKIIALDGNWQQQWSTSRWIDHPKASCPASPMPPMPNSIIYKDKVATTIDGVKFVFYHFGPAHTRSDLIAYLPDYKIAFIGDIVMDKNFNKSQPDQDHNMFWKSEKGGTPLGMFHNVDELLKLPATGFVSGHASYLMNKDDLKRITGAVKADYARVVQMTKSGMSEDDVEKAMGEDKFAPRARCIAYATLPWFAWNETMRKKEELK